MCQFLDERPDITCVVLIGIEAHVCVLQTACWLLTKGKRVIIIEDAVSSQRASDRDSAFRVSWYLYLPFPSFDLISLPPLSRTTHIQRLDKIGCTLTTSESFVFEILGTSKHPKFKQILPLVKEAHAPLAQQE